MSKLLKNKSLLLLALIFGIGLYFRLLGIDKGNLWYDEIGSFSVAAQAFPLGIIEKLRVDDVHAPLYFFILHFWMKLFGNEEIVLRMLSVIFGVLNIPAVYLLGKNFFSTKAGLCAAALMAVNSMQIYYSQEIRMYSMLSFLSVVSVYFLLKILQQPNHRNYIGFLLSNILILYTSNLAALFVFAEVVTIFSVFCLRKDFSGLKRLILYQIICLLIYTPHLLFLTEQTSNFKEYSKTWPDFKNRNIVEFLLFQLINLLTPFIKFAYPFVEKSFQSLKFAFYLILFIATPLLTFAIPLFKTIKQNKNIKILILLMFIFLLTETALLLNPKVPLEYRYAILISPVMIVMWAYAISLFEKKSVFAFLLAGSLGVYLYFHLFTPFGPMHMSREDELNQKIVKILKANNLSANDYVFSYMRGDGFLKDYYSKYIGIDSKIILYSGGFKEWITNENLDYLDYLHNNTQEKKFETFLEKIYFEQIPGGSKVIILYRKGLKSDGIILEKIKEQKIKRADTEKFENYLINLLCFSKYGNDFLRTAEKNLNLVKSEQYKNIMVYVFMKK